ncbi:MAG TPA: acyl carrier protein [Ignavibacteria bacterium]|jgi:acyl carrier protein|nr:acyl carrier protein [Ignavibacteria bacterium]
MPVIKEELLDYIKNEYLDEDDDRDVTFETPLISGGIVDSFSMVSLKVFLETKFGIQIPDAKATPEAFDTVNNITNLLEELGVK